MPQVTTIPRQDKRSRMGAEREGLMPVGWESSFSKPFSGSGLNMGEYPRIPRFPRQKRDSAVWEIGVSI